MRALAWLLSLSLLIIAGASAQQQQRSSLSGMSGDEIKALQRRLTDGGCFQSAIDGQASAALLDAINACPSQAPTLRIETGMHTAPIRRLAGNRDCSLLATGSEDMTVRLWSMPDGRLLKTLRPAIGANAYDGQIYAVAISPDGRTVAAGGQDAGVSVRHVTGVYLFDVRTGALKARVGEFDGPITQLIFSPDGHFLVLTLGVRGIRVVDVESGREIAADRDYGADTGSYGATFAPDGRLFTVGDDGYLRSYDTGFRLAQKILPRGGHAPRDIALNPAGTLLAVSYSDSTAIDIYNSSTLSLAFSVPTAGLNSDFLAVAWSSDGSVLAAAGDYYKERKFPIVLWARGGRGPRREQALSTHSVYDVVSCASGFAFSSGEPMFALLSKSGTPLLVKREVGAEMRLKRGDAFMVSRDGHTLRFGLGEGTVDPVVFDLTRSTLRTADTGPANEPAELAMPKVTGLPLTNWIGEVPRLAGRPLTLPSSVVDEHSQSLAITPDNAGFVLGTDFALLAFDAHGRELWEHPAPGVDWGVNVSGDGRLVLAAYGDGTIRWHRWSDGKELLALFVNRQSKAWVAWTPSGYYMASPGGEDLIGWHVNRGWSQSADFFPASRFRERFNRPDIVRLVLDTLDEDAAVKQANAQAKRREDTRPLIDHLPPVIRIVDPADGASVSTDKITLAYAVRSPSGQPVDRLDFVIDGRPVKSIGLPIKPLAPDSESQGSVQVTLTQHVSEVGLIAWSGGLSSQAAQVKVTWSGAPEVNRKLYALVVGVSNYADPSMTLKYAAKDATDFAKALGDQKGRYYADVQARVLTDRAVTRVSILEGLQWLAKMATNPNDISVLFLAGHGMTDEEQTYWYYTADANDDNVRINGVSQDEIRKSLQRLEGKVLWFLDTCHAGTAAKRPVVDMNVLVNTVSASENGGIVVFASSTGRQVSVEAADVGNGAFTKAVVEGIALGKADLLGDGFITTSSLDTYVAHRVAQFTSNQQTPVMERPPEEPDFAIAEVKK